MNLPSRGNCSVSGLDGAEISGDDAKEVRRFREGIGPYCVVSVGGIIDGAFLEFVAISEEDGIGLFVGFDAYFFEDCHVLEVYCSSVGMMN